MSISLTENIFFPIQYVLLRLSFPSTPLLLVPHHLPIPLDLFSFCFSLEKSRHSKENNQI